MSGRSKNGRITNAQVKKLESRVIAHWLKMFGVKNSEPPNRPGHGMKVEPTAKVRKRRKKLEEEEKKTSGQQ